MARIDPGGETALRLPWRRRWQAAGRRLRAALRSIALAASLSLAATPTLSEAQLDALVARLDLQVGRMIGLVPSNAYYRFTSQRVARRGEFLCVETRQERGRSYTHQACARFRDLNRADVALSESLQLYAHEDQLGFGLSVGCGARPCVGEVVVYDDPRLSRRFRLGTHLSLACRYRCEDPRETLRQALAAAGAPTVEFSAPDADKAAEIAAAIGRSARTAARPSGRSTLAPSAPSDTDRDPPQLNHRPYAVLGRSLCAVAPSEGSFVVYRCAAVADLDPGRLADAPTGLQLACRTGPCVGVTHFDPRTGEIAPHGNGEALEFGCGRACGELATLLCYLLRVAGGFPQR